jgi:DNA-binding NarL/FixJ family response regulator
MANLLQESTTEKQRSVVRFWAKGLNAKDIKKKMFRV